MKKILMVSMVIILISSVAAAAEKRFTIPIGDSPSKGPKDAPVTIIEFIDFQ